MEKVSGNKDWASVEKEQDINVMVTKFQTLINQPLDEVAPIKTFKIKSQYRYGIYDSTKQLMKSRGNARQQIHKASTKSKLILQKIIVVHF